jgi:hypothetical protein
MIEDREAFGRRPRTPRELRRRRRWWIVAAVAAGWVVLEVLAGSATSATVLLVVLACLGAAGLDIPGAWAVKRLAGGGGPRRCFRRSGCGF